MRIRNEQMAALSAGLIDQFENEMVCRLTTSFPDRTDPLGEQRLRELIRVGIARAAQHGFDAQFDVERYLELTLRVCPDFDTNPATPWAREILGDENLYPADKLEHLEAHAVLNGWIAE